MGTLFLGSCDLGKSPSNRKSYLKPYHIDGLLVGKVSLRDDDRTKWRSFREIEGTNVLKLQEFLLKAGFMPRASLDGIFGYVTQAAVRLFQEYVRTIENFPKMIPDGFVGSTTMTHVTRWKQENKISQWGLASSANGTAEYKAWMALLKKAKRHYIDNPGPILKQVNGLPKTYSTRKPSDWDFNPDNIHLIGIRRQQEISVNRRLNDDLFVLLINGLVFTFWGSTDSSAKMANRPDEPFLVEGQHIYRFGWHKITNEKKIYRALKPFVSKGVLVIRDWDNNNALTNNDLKVRDAKGKLKGLSSNNSINIHWTGIGNSNFSAGCQVIAGKSYLNHLGQLQDCSSFASTSYAGLSDAKRKTKGAYNVFTDLILCYAKPNDTQLYYTLGREESLNLDSNFASSYAINTISKLKSL